MADNREPSEALDLEALRKLCDEATPGPWYRHYAWVTTGGPEPTEGDEDERWVAGFARSTITRDPQRIADANFIAAARSALPSLIAEVDRLHRQITQLAQELDQIIQLEQEIDGKAARNAWMASSDTLRYCSQRLRALVAPLSSPDNQEKP